MLCDHKYLTKCPHVSYHHARKSIREAYEENFPPLDSREVIVHRVVNIVEKRSSVPRPAVEYERGYDDGSYFSGSRNYQGGGGYHDTDGFPPSDSRYHDGNPNYFGFHRTDSPQRSEDSYYQQYYSRDDLRHHLSSRSRNKSHNHYHHHRKRGRGFGASSRDDHDYRNPKSLVITRERSPPRKEPEPPVAARSRSNSSNRSVSPNRDKGHTYQQQQKQKASVVKSHTPSSSVEGSPHSSASSKEKTSVSTAEPEEAVAASVEPKLTPEEDLKARRWGAINTKVLEIEKLCVEHNQVYNRHYSLGKSYRLCGKILFGKMANLINSELIRGMLHYRQDCETFRTVVKMLVAKEPSLETLLQTSLDKNLLEIRQHCLESLKSFVSELDEILDQPTDSA